MAAGRTERKVTITHKRGLHLSPASIFAEHANRFRAEVQVALGEKPGEKWNGKRVIDLMSIGAICGQELLIAAQGDDASDAVDTLVALVQRDFGLTS